MPLTRIHTLGRERSIATLARKVFDIQDASGAKDLQRRAEAALIAANPSLATPEGFKAGDRIIVPVVHGLAPASGVGTAAVDKESLASETALRLNEAASRIKEAFAGASEARKRTLDRLSDQGFLREAEKALPGSSKILKKAAKNMSREAGNAEEVAMRLGEAVAGASAALGKLKDLP